MGQTRREFMRDAAVTGAVVAAGTTVSLEKAHTAPNDVFCTGQRCPFFDQPLLCDGPDADGKYLCDDN